MNRFRNAPPRAMHGLAAAMMQAKLLDRPVHTAKPTAAAAPSAVQIHAEAAAVAQDLRAVAVALNKLAAVEHMLAAYDKQIAAMPADHVLRLQAEAMVDGVRSAMRQAEAAA